MSKRASAARQGNGSWKLGGGALLLVALLLLLQHGRHETALAVILGLVSALTLVLWIPVVMVARATNGMDEADLYDGGANAGMVVFYPLGLSVFWLFAFSTVLIGRALFGQQPIFAAALATQAKLFGGVTGVGVLLVVAASCCPKWGSRDED